MSSLLGRTALSVGGSIFGGLLGSGIQYGFQRKLMDHQFELQKQMLDYTNEYNSPVNQMKRLTDAGINKNLAVEGANSVAGSSTPSIGGGSASMPNTRIDILGAMTAGQNLELLKEQTNLKAEEVAHQRLENDRLRAESPYWSDNAMFRSDTLKWLNSSAESKSQIDEVNKQLAWIIRDANTGENRYYDFIGGESGVDTPLYRATVDKLTREGLTNDEINSRINKINSDVMKIGAQIVYLAKQGRNLDMRTSLLDLEKRMKETLGVSYNDDLGWRLLARFLSVSGISPEELAKLVGKTAVSGPLSWLFQ